MPDLINDLVTGGTTAALTAEQGKVLSTSISTLATQTNTSISELNADVDFNVTNLITNGDFSNGTTGWAASAGTSLTVENGRAKILASSQWGCIEQSKTLITGHKYYYSVGLDGTTDNYISMTGQSGLHYNPTAGLNRLSNIFTAASTSLVIQIGDKRTSGWTSFYADYVQPIDLTATFGAGNEPTAAEMDAILAFYPNSWFNGTVNLASNPKMLPYLLNATRNRPIMVSGTYAARPTSVTFPTLYLSTDKIARNSDRLTLNFGGTAWLQI